MGIARLLAKGWIVFCLFAGAHALRLALLQGQDLTISLPGIGICALLFIAMGLLFVGGFGVSAGHVAHTPWLKSFKPHHLIPGFNEGVFFIFVVLSFLNQAFVAPSTIDRAMVGALQNAIYFVVPGQRALVSALDRLPLAQRVTGRDRLNQMLYVNAKTVLPNFILNYLADRMEMAHSIEGRVPFLDHRVAEVAARVPVNMKVKGIRVKHVRRGAAKDVLIPEVYDRQKHPFTTPPTRNTNDPMLAFYRDTFASQAAKDQPIYDMKKVSTTLDQLLACPDDQRIAVEGGLQRVASVIVMHELFSMA